MGAVGKTGPAGPPGPKGPRGPKGFAAWVWASRTQALTYATVFLAVAFSGYVGAVSRSRIKSTATETRQRATELRTDFEALRRDVNLNYEALRREVQRLKRK